MAEIKLTNEELEQIAMITAETVAGALLDRIEKIDKLPPLLTRKQFMEVANIKDKKCNELFNRPDFPVTRELGHPRVVTSKLFEWIEQDIENRAMIDFPYYYTS